MRNWAGNIRLGHAAWCIVLLLVNGAALAQVPTLETPNISDDAGGWRLLGDGMGQLQNLDEAKGSLSFGAGYSSSYLDATIVYRFGIDGAALANREDYGVFLLTPETAPVAFDMRATLFPWKKGNSYHGPYGRLSLGRSTWQVADPAGGEAPLEAKATAIASSIGYAWRVVNKSPAAADAQKGQGNDIALTLGAGLTGRRIAGDVADEEEFRRLAIHTGKLSYWGLECSATLQINGIAVTASLPYIFAGGVKGLGSGQFLLTVELGGGIKLF